MCTRVMTVMVAGVPAVMRMRVGRVRIAGSRNRTLARAQNECQPARLRIAVEHIAARDDNVREHRHAAEQRRQTAQAGTGISQPHNHPPNISRNEYCTYRYNYGFPEVSLQPGDSNTTVQAEADQYLRAAVGPPRQNPGNLVGPAQ